MAGQTSRSRPRPPRACPQWQEGDIAFLAQSERMNAEDFEVLVAQGYIPKAATGHPVIVLRRLSEDSTHVLITPVSAYSWEMNGRQPPWRQRHHKRKRRADFRSFEGSERVNNTRPFLCLQPGQAMPKESSSWVYIQSVWAVPITALCVFTKPKTTLSMHPESLEELRQHMAAECSSWGEGLRKLDAAAPDAAPPVAAPAAAAPPASNPTADNEGGWTQATSRRRGGRRRTRSP